MVLDLQDVDATLEDAVAKSQIRLFGSSSRPLAVQPEAGPSTLRPSDASSEESGSEEEGCSWEDDDEQELGGEDEQLDVCDALCGVGVRGVRAGVERDLPSSTR